MDSPGATLGPYSLIRDIGAGSTGKVKLAENRETGERVAIKIIRKAAFNATAKAQNKIQREIALLRLVNHPNILKMVDCLESPKHLMMVLEYASKGELFDYLVERRSLDISTSAKLFRQIIYALEYLHGLGICHRDLKPENILLDGNENVKLADFGFARFTKENVVDTTCGSPHYTAPEVIKGAPYDGRAADIWSCGVMLFALLSGTLPFDDVSVRSLLLKVKKGKYTIPESMPEVAANLIKQMLVVNPEKRITIDMIKKDPFFRINLPEGYVCPWPLPVRAMNDPFEMASIPKEVVEILKRIGFTDEAELTRDLTSTNHTVAKVFVAMLTFHGGFDQLDWSKSDGGTQAETIIIDPSGTEGTFQRALRLRSSADSASFINSCALRPDWSVATETGNVPLQSLTIKSSRSDVELLLAVQRILSARGWQWFHPDGESIIAKKEDTFVGVDLLQGTDSQISLTRQIEVVLYGGSNNEFQMLCSELCGNVADD